MIELLSLITVILILVTEWLSLADQWYTNRFQRAYWKERADFYARRLRDPNAKLKVGKTGSTKSTPADVVETPKSPPEIQTPLEPPASNLAQQQPLDTASSPEQLHPLADEPQGSEIESDKLPSLLPKYPVLGNLAVDSLKHKDQ